MAESKRFLPFYALIFVEFPNGREMRVRFSNITEVKPADKIPNIKSILKLDPPNAEAYEQIIEQIDNGEI